MTAGRPPPWVLDHGWAELSLHGQDRTLLRPDRGLFGVFDGVGQFEVSGFAAACAAETVGAAHHPGGALPSELDPVRRIADALRAAHTTIVERRWGATTALVVRLLPSQAAVASVGDSRLYARVGTDPLHLLTIDEGVGNLLDNWLGEGLAPHGARVSQTALIPIDLPMTLVLVTDGITGDFPPDLLGPRELTAAVTGVSAQAGAERLVAAARKHDDRTAVVLQLARPG